MRLPGEVHVPGFSTYCFAREQFVWGLPEVELALREPDGLLAAGGTIEPATLLYAYRRGVFPWYSEGQPVLWWSPDPRCVLFPASVHVSRSLRKRLRQGVFEVTCDTAFDQVIDACAGERTGATGTWITHEMRAGYLELHSLGHAHSIECWHAGELAGGLYGVTIGRMFFGESMFTRVADGSKVALVTLCASLRQWGYALVDCQVQNAHLARMGAGPMPRPEFIALLDRHCQEAPSTQAWTTRQLNHDPAP